MKHDELQHDLATSFAGNGETILEKLSLGSYGGNGQMDVFRMKLSRTNPNPTCYEVKVSRSDFHADTQAGKYRRYLPYVRRLYFAAPAGMLSKDEIPGGCGLTVRGDKGWSVIKAAPIYQPDPEKWPSLLLSIVLKLHPGPWSQPDREERIRRALRRVASEDSLRHLGLQLSAAVSGQLEDARLLRHRYERDRQYLAQRLGINPDSPEAQDISHLADRILEAAPPPAEIEGMVKRQPLEMLLHDIRAQERSATRMRERLERALEKEAVHA